MNMKIIYAAFALFLAGGCAFARDPDWFNQRMQALEVAEHLQDREEKIEALSRFVRAGGFPQMDAEQKTLYERARNSLLSIPGHSKYYQNKIQTSRDAVKKGELSGFQYAEIRREAYATLHSLPSHETIAVIGHFLEDPEGRDSPKRTGIYLWYGDSAVIIPCAQAAGTMESMGIENPPKVSKGDDGLEQVDAWKDWWNEVKAGKRTYRFIGSPIEYGPNGPVAAKELSRREHDRQSGSNKVSNGSLNADADPSNAGSSLWSKIAGGGAALLLLIGAWFAFGRRSANSHS